MTWADMAAISARDANSALAMHVDLLTSATGEMTAWVVSRLREAIGTYR